MTSEIFNQYFKCTIPLFLYSWIGLSVTTKNSQNMCLNCILYRYVLTEKTCIYRRLSTQWRLFTLRF